MAMTMAALGREASMTDEDGLWNSRSTSWWALKSLNFPTGVTEIVAEVIFKEYPRVRNGSESDPDESRRGNELLSASKVRVGHQTFLYFNVVLSPLYNICGNLNGSLRQVCYGKVPKSIAWQTITALTWAERKGREKGLVTLKRMLLALPECWQSQSDCRVIMVYNFVA